MNREKRANLAASVRQRLLNISRETGTDANFVWSRFVIERLLYRLASSDHGKKFVLKGALLFMVWTGQPYRPTYDLDLLGYGDSSSKRIADIFKDICEMKVEQDGLIFDAKSVQVEPIREGQEYQGQRITLNAFLGKARVTIRVDIGFGDVVTPAAKMISYPILLDFPAPRIRAYTCESFVAEKLHALVVLGVTNSRMKDFYDLYVVGRDFSFQGNTLAEAIRATFERRKTSPPTSIPLSLTDEFAMDGVKQTQWNAFCRKGGLKETVPSLADVIGHLRNFLLPPLSFLTSASTKEAFGKIKWSAGGPWK